ncbi:hypothetical protein [Pseudofulvibacter geojedonensis]|uniref:Uncharacterized protein n=1 Tax=Pseudofulvibacter geojedonensis TaxID=1123758 RepID=A0ABW3HZ61_9FLAO
MNKILLVLTLLLSSFMLADNACLVTYQYKIFPVGVFDNKIIAVDVEIMRSDYKGKENDVKVQWQLKSFYSVYNFNQKRINSVELNNEVIKSSSYLDVLKEKYSLVLEEIKAKFKNIDYFEVNYLSYCDFQKNCEKVKMISDNNENTYLSFEGEKFLLNFSLNYKLNDSALASNDLSAYYISSVRIYQSKKIKIVLPHLETGHEISMGWYTSDPKKKPKDYYNTGTVIISKEHKPNFSLHKQEIPVYEEPLLHHAYGYDFLIKVN